MQAQGGWCWLLVGIVELWNGMGRRSKAIDPHLLLKALPELLQLLRAEHVWEHGAGRAARPRAAAAPGDRVGNTHVP
jgi:hypothetical protein